MHNVYVSFLDANLVIGCSLQANSLFIYIYLTSPPLGLSP